MAGMKSYIGRKCCTFNSFVKNLLLAPSEVSPPPTGVLKLLWDDIVGLVAVVDPASVSEWNTFFDLPTNGTPFTSVAVVGNEVQLSGGNGITLAAGLFQGDSHIVSVVDDALCIVAMGNDCFLGAALIETVTLNACLNVMLHDNFRNTTTLIFLSLASCTNLGATVGEDQVFLGLSGNNITLTVPAALMTCDAGNPDGDIAYLQANNTVVIITV